MIPVNTFLIILLLIPLVMPVEVKEEIYIAHASHPSFYCPGDSLRCELYRTGTAWNMEIDPPILVKTCEPSIDCSHVNFMAKYFNVRILPGDVCYPAESFKGYKIKEVAYTTTTSTTTTSTTTTTQPIIPQRTCTKYLRGRCVRYEEIHDTATTTLITITTTTTAPTTTTLNYDTTTTTLHCLSSGESCSLNSECCSGNCKNVRSCLNPTIHGFCWFPHISKSCE